MRWMKRCPKCGSTNLAPAVFYLPSIWRCSDCGYEGAFIIEGDAFAEKAPEHYLDRPIAIDRLEQGLDVDVWNDSDGDFRNILGG